jgi:hypothetical protein
VTRVAWVCVAVVVATLLSLTPLVVPALRRPPLLPFGVQLPLLALALALPVATLLACWRFVPLDLDRRAKAGLYALLVGLTLLQVHLHFTEVDLAPHRYSTGAFQDNTHWQRVIHAAVLDGATGATIAGHNARVLPNGFTQLLIVATNSFVTGRTIYRLTFQLLLLLSIYLLGRAWFSHRAALLGLAFYALVYPVSLRYYAGQLTDPMSHLSFTLGMLFLARGPFAYLALAVLVGVVAKESVILIALAYALLRRDDARWLPRSTLLLGGGLGLIWLIRWLVDHDAPTAESLSGQAFEHLHRNLAEWRLWIPQVAFTLGLFAPFLALGWRRCPPLLRGLCVLLATALLATSARFSWLREARNFVPAAIPMGIVAAAWLMGELDEPSAAT